MRLLKWNYVLIVVVITSWLEMDLIHPTIDLIQPMIDLRFLVGRKRFFWIIVGDLSWCLKGNFSNILRVLALGIFRILLASGWKVWDC